MDDTNKRIIISVDADTSGVSSGIQQVKSELNDISQVDLTKSVKGYSQEIRKSIDELRLIKQQYGENSKEFAAGIKKVADLKDEFKKVNDTVKAFDPGNKLAPLVGITQSLALSTQGVVGAFQFLGTNVDDVGKQIARLQGLMAFTEVLGNIDQLKDGFVNLGKVVQSNTVYQKAMNVATTTAATVQKLFTGSVNTTSVSFKVLRTAIASTGIGLLVIAIVAVIQNFKKIKDTVLNLFPVLKVLANVIGGLIDKFKDFFDTSSDVEKALTKAGDKALEESKRIEKELKYNRQSFTDDQLKALEATKKYYDSLNELSKEEGLNDEERKKFRKGLEEQYYKDIKQINDDKIKNQKETNDKIRQQNQKEIDDQRNKRNQIKQIYDSFQTQYKQAYDNLIKISQDAEKELSLIGKSDREKELIQLDDSFKEKVKLIQNGYSNELGELNKALNSGTISRKEYNDKIVQLNDERDKSISLLDQLNQNNRLEVEKKYAQQVSDVLNETLKTDYDKQKDEIKKKFDDLIQNTTDAQTKLRLELEKNKQLGNVDVKQNLDTNVTNSETNLIQTQIDNQIQENDPIQTMLDKTRNIIEARQQLLQDSYEQSIQGLDQNSAEYLNKYTQYQQDQLDIQKDYDDQQKQIEELSLNRRIQLLDNVGKSLTALTDVVGKNTVAGKGLAIASALIDTYKSVTTILANKTVLPEPFGTINKIASIATALATGFSSIKNIGKVQVPGYGSSGAVPGGISAGSAPIVNSTSINTPTQQVDVRVNNDVPLRAYVVDKDIQNNQQRRDFLNSISTF